MTPTGEPRGTVTLRWSGRLSGAIETAWAILDISPRSEDRRCSTDLPRHERQTSDSADRRAEGYMPSAGNIQDHPSRLNNTVSVLLNDTHAVATVITGISPDTGATDGVTKAGLVTVNGTAEANSTVRLSE